MSLTLGLVNSTKSFGKYYLEISFGRVEKARLNKMVHSMRSWYIIFFIYFI